MKIHLTFCSFVNYSSSFLDVAGHSKGLSQEKVDTPDLKKKILLVIFSKTERKLKMMSRLKVFRTPVTHKDHHNLLLLY